MSEEGPADPVFGAFCEAGLWPGLGRTLTAALPSAGINGPDDVDQPTLLKLPQVGLVRADKLLKSFAAARPAYDVVALLLPAGIQPRLAARLVDTLGADAATQLAEDPWRLLDLPDVKVAEADRLAVATIPGVRRDDPRRGRALVGYALGRAARDGHTALPAPMVAKVLAGEQVADPVAAIREAVEAGRVLACEPELPEADTATSPDTDTDAGTDTEEPPALLALERYAMAEDAIADGLARLLANAEPMRPPDGLDLDTLEGMDSLDDRQRSAVHAVLEHGVSVLTGGPGTGKSRTVSTVVALARALDKRIALAAPTGRAAKRLEELTGAEASTLHRLLGAQGMTGDFARGEEWPLDADLIVVDESSMLDAELAAALVEACADGTHLLFVGDPAQLPSIGAGRVLGDILDAGVVPVTELTTLYRQEQGGSIARLATAVRGGELPPVDDPTHEVVVVPARQSAEAAHRVVQLVTDSIPRALGIPAADVQVVTPVHRGPAGTIELNQALKARLNPGDGKVSGFDAGDRVVATANHLDLGFANGEVGVVTDTAHGELTVAFAAGEVTVSGKPLGDLRHGWAVTVHRAQGSEWPAVVAVMPPEAAGMLSRPLVYTALTRASRHLSVVHAAGRNLARAVREVGARPRRTRLRGLLRDAAGA
jgi:exodeoxyribonuclease V alpha subunit